MDFEKYVMPLKWPISPTRPKEPRFNGSSDEYRAFADQLDAWRKEVTDYDEQVKKCQQQQAENYAAFKVDALKEVGLWGHEAGNRAFEYANERGDTYKETFEILTKMAYIILGPR
jgi:hypothetical protein